jgi:predicted nucleotidyltransferase
MKEFEKIRSVLSDQKEFLRNKYRIKEISIFGSVVRREEGDISDIDILVDFSEPIGFFAFLELEEYLEQLLGRKVDLVSRKALKPKIGERILKEAVSV